VEIDSTYYGVPRALSVEKWYDSVPRDFIFTPKFPQDITHHSNLTGVEDLLLLFLERMSLLKEKLGPILIQFPYTLKPDEMSDNLGRFLKKLPDEFNFVVEVRNRKWLNDKFYDMLRKEKIGLALVDHPRMPKIEVVTSKTLYMRFLGDRKIITKDFSHVQLDRKENLDEWQRILRAIEEKVDDFYGYFNNHYSGHAPSTAKYFRDLLAEQPANLKHGAVNVMK
jgi:uncharacterized protein YecE (DUF72 family)